MNPTLIHSSHQKLKVLMQTYFDIAQEVLFSLDQNFVLKTVNAFAIESLKLPEVFLLHCPLYELCCTQEEREFIDQHLKNFARSKQHHLQFTMCWSSPAGKKLEMAIQLSKFEDQYIGSAKNLNDTLSTLSELYESKSNFETLIDQNFTGILITDLQGTILFANHAAADLLNQTQDALLGVQFGYILSNDTDDKFEIDLIRRNAPPGRAEVSSLITTWREQPAKLIVLHDISELHAAQKHIEKLAYFDSLTHLPNRAFFMNMLNQTLERYRHQTGGFALFYIDFNNFKSVNENFGHAHGDQLLVKAAHLFKNTLGNENLLARIGGDEYSAIIENVTNPQKLKQIALNILKACQTPLIVNQEKVLCKPSIGITLYPENATQADEMLNQADLAVRVAKQNPAQGNRI